jgi:hypothetical protein
MGGRGWPQPSVDGWEAAAEGTRARGAGGGGVGAGIASIQSSRPARHACCYREEWSERVRVRSMRWNDDERVRPPAAMPHAAHTFASTH